LNTIVDGLGALEGRPFTRDVWTKAPGGKLEGGGTTCILEGGELFERGGVAMSDVRGKALPPSATQRNPHLAGKGFHAVGVSLVMHPRNPNVPTAHLNVRSFRTEDNSAWWFGGGFDLTPYFHEVEDEAHWKSVSRATCERFGGATMYEQLAADCDEYFTLKHRQERRGLGGIFFDDLNESHPFGGTFEHCWGFTRAVGLAFLDAYPKLVAAHMHEPWTAADREHQRVRRGRYVEFNLLYDRGTTFGLKTGGNVEAILMSLPPDVSWP
jgi:coproporphyrinogen III oxidase